MSGLPPRFPRARLINTAASIESAIQYQLDITQQKIDDAEDLGLGQVTNKLAQRFNTLDDARAIANELRLRLWELK